MLYMDHQPKLKRQMTTVMQSGIGLEVTT